ncbi:MAG: HAD family hydrolase [Oscillospiraceae bacterium]|jgi:phosphoglycolate phosphatase|nr:HAD family hydrolase [Oscillospiraceae bacterium]MDD3832621.1 HAD family hydrolase [Oscillospiraceae bacterium]MDD4545921.1 HAD family hydrolase [Oscillospiraceae bacterium]
MSNFKYVLLDLDGTLTDPALGITNSVIYSLRKFNIEVEDRKELYSFIGPPLTDSYMKYFGFSEEEALKAIDYYREYYKDKGIYENAVYNGVIDLLKVLKDKGKMLILATSKPEVFAKRILVHFEMEKYFDFVAGSNLDGTRVKKDEVISYALKSCNISDLSDAVMIGDREHDIIGAKKTGLHSIGVLYGYGTKEELENAGADLIAQRVEDIEGLIS